MSEVRSWSSNVVHHAVGMPSAMASLRPRVGQPARARQTTMARCVRPDVVRPDHAAGRVQEDQADDRRPVSHGFAARPPVSQSRRDALDDVRRDPGRDDVARVEPGRTSTSDHSCGRPGPAVVQRAVPSTSATARRCIRSAGRSAERRGGSDCGLEPDVGVNSGQDAPSGFPSTHRAFQRSHCAC